MPEGCSSIPNHVQAICFILGSLNRKKVIYRVYKMCNKSLLPSSKLYGQKTTHWFWIFCKLRLYIWQKGSFLKVSTWRLDFVNGYFLLCSIAHSMERKSNSYFIHESGQRKFLLTGLIFYHYADVAFFSRKPQTIFTKREVCSRF